jgi:predicted DNA-binding transcriptional regulator YafY
MTPNLQFIYKNYQGKVGIRNVRPLAVRYGTSPYHPEPTWLMLAWDADKGTEREFDMTQMSALAAAAGE